MKILLILKDDLDCRTPILTLTYSLVELGHVLKVVALGVKQETKKFLESNGSTAIIIHPPKVHNCSFLNKILQWITFRNKVKKIINQSDDYIIWICSADAAISIGHDLLSKKYILQIQELYDSSSFYRKRLKKFMQCAHLVVVPEETRAHIFRAWYQLNETPTVLPNKPHLHPRKRKMQITDPEAAKAFSKIPKGSRIVFYQGGFNKGHLDMMKFAKAIEELGPPWVFVLQFPKNNSAFFNELFKKYKFTYIPFVAPPKHLEITSNVDFCIVTYKHSILNNEFCAPNKIWEYSGFGHPIIGNDVYGLKNTIGNYKAGEIINFDKLDVEKIKKILVYLDQNYQEFSENSTKFFESINYLEIVGRIVSFAQNEKE